MCSEVTAASMRGCRRSTTSGTSPSYTGSRHENRESESTTFWTLSDFSAGRKSGWRVSRAACVSVCTSPEVSFTILRWSFWTSRLSAWIRSAHDSAQIANSFRLLHSGNHPSADHFCEYRFLHVSRRRTRADTPLCGARCRTYGHLVRNIVWVRRNHPVGTMAGDPRAAGCGTRSVCAGATSIHSRNLIPRDVLDRSHIAVGQTFLRHPAGAREPAAVCCCDPGNRSRAWALGARVGLDFHPLPQCKCPCEPSRIPGVAGHGSAGSALTAARLGRSDRLCARPHVGHQSDPGVCTGWGSLVCDRHDLGAGNRLPSRRRFLHSSLRAPGA